MFYGHKTCTIYQCQIRNLSLINIFKVQTKSVFVFRMNTQSKYALQLPITRRFQTETQNQRTCTLKTIDKAPLITGTTNESFIQPKAIRNHYSKDNTSYLHKHTNDDSVSCKSPYSVIFLPISSNLRGQNSSPLVP